MRFALSRHKMRPRRRQCFVSFKKSPNWRYVPNLATVQWCRHAKVCLRVLLPVCLLVSLRVCVCGRVFVCLIVGSLTNHGVHWVLCSRHERPSPAPPPPPTDTATVDTVVKRILLLVQTYTLARKNDACRKKTFCVKLHLRVERTDRRRESNLVHFSLKMGHLMVTIIFLLINYCTIVTVTQRQIQ